MLRNVNLEVKAGSLTCIVGRVGSGKTSLLHAVVSPARTAFVKSLPKVVACCAPPRTGLPTPPDST